MADTARCRAWTPACAGVTRGNASPRLRDAIALHCDEGRLERGGTEATAYKECPPPLWGRVRVGGELHGVELERLPTPTGRFAPTAPVEGAVFC